MALALGGTIAELQRRMTAAEFAVWAAYRRKNGPMNDVRRFDSPAAQLAMVACRLMGRKAEMRDFMPFGLEPEQPEQEATLDDIIAEFGGMNIGKPR